LSTLLEKSGLIQVAWPALKLEADVEQISTHLLCTVCRIDLFGMNWLMSSDLRIANRFDNLANVIFYCIVV